MSKLSHKIAHDLTGEFHIGDYVTTSLYPRIVRPGAVGRIVKIDGIKVWAEFKHEDWVSGWSDLPRGYVNNGKGFVVVTNE